ncbi:MAG: hypothetical protein Q4E51_06640 [Lachnospiraceae bacterium]|nr:hypothetical protein [Lachnospiraceae bacterium]
MKKIRNIYISCSKIEKAILCASFIIALFAAMFFCHRDSCEAIIPWGLDFIRTVKSGRVLDYYYQVRGIGMYNILVICISALWQLPMFIILRLFNIELYVVYVVWWKCFLILILILNCYILGSILKILKCDHKTIFTGVLAYILSPITLWGNIAMGQIDTIATLFILLAIFYFIKNKYHKMCLFASVAITFKIIPIVLFVPIIIIVSKKIKELVLYFVELVFLPILIEYLSRCIGGYVETKNTFGLSLIYENNYNYTNIFICSMIVLYVISYACNDGDKKKAFLFATIAYVIFLLNVSFHPQWVIYILPFLIILSTYIIDNFISVMLIFCTNLGYIMFVISLWEYKVDNYMVNNGILPYIFGYKYNGKTLWQTILVDISFGKSLFIAGIISIIVLSNISNTTKRVLFKEDVIGEYLCYFICSIPSILIILSSFILYFNI